MFRNFFKKNSGFTLMELMVAIAVIAIISAVSVLYVRGNINDEVEMYSEALAADLRLARNMAVSRTVYNFAAPYPALGEVYPPGGYGIYIYKPSSGSSSYTIFADSGVDGADGGTSPLGYDSDKDPIIKEVTITNTDLYLDDYNAAGISHYFTFKSENEVDTNFSTDTEGNYELLLRYPGTGYPAKGYQSVFHLGEASTDSYIWTNIGIEYSTYSPPAPPPAPRDPIDEISL
ncbi:prepilin-type N-terminal cleavage/methylation domain-containing protein [Patescibacteria group bacterium]|nr:prepilin-type N-terminal cleavage/methylation domain-containing protein [Patescibacteria group bacterium]